MDEQLTIYNKEKVFETEISPIIKQLRTICANNEIPFFCTFAVSNSAKKTVYENDGYFTGSSGIRLKEDHILDMIKVLRGVPLKTIGAVEPDDELMDYLNQDIAEDI